MLSRERREYQYWNFCLFYKLQYQYVMISPLVLVILLCDSVHLHFTPSVTTSTGVVYGKRLYFNFVSIDAYLGIPYAAPPIGHLRFRKPLPVQPWTEPINATSLPPACPQYSTFPFLWYDNGTSDENCLFLNIWAPSGCLTTSNKLSVIYWMHGGSFYLGSSAQELYNGLALAAVGDVIVVTVNYRLGPLGFLSSPSEEAPGNMGLFDMWRGLQWIHNNIEYFGGDKNSITVVGESVGSLAVGLFLISPLTKGLFRRAIMESGAPLILLATEAIKNAQVGQQLATNFGCANECHTLQNDPDYVVACLRGINAMTLAIEHSKILGTQKGLNCQNKDDFVPQDVIKTSDFHTAELMIGVNTNEGGPFLALGNVDVFGFFGEKNPQVNKSQAGEMIKNILAGFPGSEDIVNFYLSDLGEYDYTAIRKQLFEALTDSFIVCNSVYFAERFSEKQPVFFYKYKHRPSNWPYAKNFEATHFSEIPFVFGRPLLDPMSYTEEEKTLSLAMIMQWTNFAKTGVPHESWRRYFKQSRWVNVLDIDALMPFENGPSQKACDFLRPYFGV